jgi:hypothetical protein
LVKSVAPDFLQIENRSGDTKTVTYTFVVTNPSQVPLSNVTLVDPNCTNITGPVGDANSNNLLEPTETWTYQCVLTRLFQPDSYPNTAQVTGLDTLLRVVSDTSTAVVEAIYVNMEKTASTDCVCNGDSSVDYRLIVRMIGSVNLTVTNVIITDSNATVNETNFVSATRVASGTQYINERYYAYTLNLSQTTTNVATDTQFIRNLSTNSSTALTSPPSAVTVTYVNPALAVSVTPSNQVVASGGNAQMQVVVRNTGDVALADVTVTSSAGGLNQLIPLLQAGEAQTFTVNVNNVTASTTVNVSASGGVAGKDCGAEAAASATVTLPEPASLGDRVWQDSNGNGIQDPGEPGIPGVVVTLNTPTGPIQTTTDANGLYTFTGLTPNVVYTVLFTPPAGYQFSPQGAGGNAATDSNANPATGLTGPITLAPGENNLTIDAGLYQPASLGDRVWLDTNGNGRQDPGEAGVPGVTVTLQTPAGPVQTVTDGSGLYTFTNLTPGVPYTVTFAPPANHGFSPQNQGDAAGDSNPNSAGVSAPVTLLSGENNTTVDAGLVPNPASLGDRVWYDANFNGVQDAGEPGIAGATVVLHGPSGNITATTSTTGFYQFTGLVPGTYSVTVTAPGYRPTTQDAGNDAADSDVDSTGNTASIVLSAGQNNTTVDAGMIGTGTIGDKVWNDSPNTGTPGVQDPAELGLNGVTVVLYCIPHTLTRTQAPSNVDCLSSQPIATTTTTGNGGYLFTNLPPGSYAVQFVVPPDDEGNIAPFSPVGVGAADKDSNANVATGRTGPIVLSPGSMTDLTVDAGVLKSITAVTLESFGVTRSGSKANIAWRTTSERNTVGFYVYRAQGQLAGSQIPSAAIRVGNLTVASGTPSSGASYSLIDAFATASSSYTYWLVEVEVDGRENVYGPATISNGGALLFLPITVSQSE